MGKGRPRHDAPPDDPERAEHAARELRAAIADAHRALRDLRAGVAEVNKEAAAIGDDLLAGNMRKSVAEAADKAVVREVGELADSLRGVREEYHARIDDLEQQAAAHIAQLAGIESPRDLMRMLARSVTENIYGTIAVIDHGELDNSYPKEVRDRTRALLTATLPDGFPVPPGPAPDSLRRKDINDERPRDSHQPAARPAHGRPGTPGAAARPADRSPAGPA